MSFATFQSCITHRECATFLLGIVQKDHLLAILVLEVASIHVGTGLLVNLWRDTTRFSMMIGDLKKRLVAHQSFGDSGVSIAVGQFPTYST
jgi:hypothetical protein